MIDLRVHIPRHQVRALDNVLRGDKVVWATREALNGTAAAAAKVALKAVAKTMGIRVSRLKKRGRTMSKTTRKLGAVSSQKANRVTLASRVWFVGKPFNLSRFNAKEIRGGDRTSIKTRRRLRARKGKRGRVLGVVHEAWGRKQFAKGLFILGKGNRGPVVKAGRGSTKAKRGKIDSAYGPGVTHIASYPKVRKATFKTVRTQFPRRFANRLAYATSGAFHAR